MSEHPNVARILQGYERFAARDVEAVLRLLSDDVVWHVSGAASPEITRVGTRSPRTSRS
jgi:ketosteroid isomerase-like protein